MYVNWCAWIYHGEVWAVWLLHICVQHHSTSVCICSCMYQRGVKVLIFVFIKRLSTHDLDLAVHGGPRMDYTLAKPLSFGGCCRDVWVDGRFAEVDVKNVCAFKIGAMHCIHGDDVYKLFELPANEEKTAEFCVAPLLSWFGISVWHVVFFVGAIFVWRVEQRLVELKVSSGDVLVVILFDVSVHEARFKVVFDFCVLAVDCVHVGCPFWIDDTTKFGGIVEW